MAGTCSGFIEPLNLDCWLINVFAGTTEIFMFVAFIVLAGVMAMFKMRNETALLLFSIFLIMFSYYMPPLLILVILLGGIIIFFSFKAPFSRN